MEYERDELDRHNAIRKKLWCDVVIAVHGASNSTNPSSGITWADSSLKEFDERFPKPVITVNTP